MYFFRILLLSLLAVSVAHAEHHRGHVQVRLDSIIAYADQVDANLDLMAGKCPVEMQATNHWNTLRFYNNSVRKMAYFIADDLNTAEPDLKALRRLVNMPDFVTEPFSMSWKAVQMENAVNVLQSYYAPGPIGSNDKCVSRTWNVVVRVTKIQQLVQEVSWHIVDAINEEIYQDQEAICSGVGNHCE